MGIQTTPAPPKRDVSGRLIEPGRYMMTQAGRRPVAVVVAEYTDGSLWIEYSVGGGYANKQRVDELAPDVRFHCIGGFVTDMAELAESDLVRRLDEILRRAAEIRQLLGTALEDAAQLLGCTVGDGSELGDSLLSAVRDGSSSALELAAQAHELRGQSDA